MIGLRFAFLLCASMSALAANKPDVTPLGADFDARNWSSYGRTAGETRFSPLNEINTDTVARLNIAWTFDLDTLGGVQSTPVAVDGVIYVAAGYSQIFAVDARTGKLLWRYEPDVLKSVGRKLRAGGSVRGLAVANGRLFVGTHDGRLLALDAKKKGTLLWSAQVLDAADASFISGAPRVLGEEVLIGFGDTGSVHGSVFAYDVASGKPRWRWTAPGGGGAVWNALTVDPETNRVFAGTGNARPADAPNNPAACSIVALDGATGQQLWQFDASPGNHLSCDDSLDITLATLTIDGAPRKVILHAPKDGSMHVLDRDSGKQISTSQLGEGAHTPFAQAFSPVTGLVYLPVSRLPPGDVDPAQVTGKSALLAWDPVKQRAQWMQPTPGPFNGAALATAGDLVFQGAADGHITAYTAAEGRRIWAYYLAESALGAPISFAVGRQQFISILVGPPTGAAASLGATSAQFGWDYRVHPRRLITFALDGAAKLPPTPNPVAPKVLDGPEVAVDDAVAEQGAKLYAQCSWCHGAGAISGGAAPDLRASAAPLNAPSFATVVRSGLAARGMPAFDELSDHDLEALRQYIRKRAWLVTRPNGLAPQAPDAGAPANPTTPATPETPADKPPGSLESTGVPPKT